MIGSVQEAGRPWRGLAWDCGDLEAAAAVLVGGDGAGVAEQRALISWKRGEADGEGGASSRRRFSVCWTRRGVRGSRRSEACSNWLVAKHRGLGRRSLGRSNPPFVLDPSSRKLPTSRARPRPRRTWETWPGRSRAPRAPRSCGRGSGVQRRPHGRGSPAPVRSRPSAPRTAPTRPRARRRSVRSRPGTRALRRSRAGRRSRCDRLATSSRGPGPFRPTRRCAISRGPRALRGEAPGVGALGHRRCPRRSDRRAGPRASATGPLGVVGSAGRRDARGAQDSGRRGGAGRARRARIRARSAVVARSRARRGRAARDGAGGRRRGTAPRGGASGGRAGAAGRDAARASRLARGRRLGPIRRRRRQATSRSRPRRWRSSRPSSGRCRAATGCDPCSSRCSTRWCCGRASSEGCSCSARPTVASSRARPGTWPGKDLTGEQLVLSQTIARRAIEEGTAIVATDAFSTLGDVHASVHALKLRSVLAVPLVARGETLGVVYLDDRVRKGAFGPRELAWVRVVASQAAMAIADARDAVLLRRAARPRRACARAGRGDARERGRGARSHTHAARAGARRDARPAIAYAEIAGRSEPMRDLLRLVDRVTAERGPGARGGRERHGQGARRARDAHQRFAIARRPFVSENCASVPETLLESTLFGHVRGAFTGASPRARGCSTSPTGERCSWTRSARCRYRCRPSCSASCRTARCVRSAVSASARWTCASSGPRTGISGDGGGRRRFARTCSTVST